MIEELYRLLTRQVAAVDAIESRLRALELVVAADERRFVAIALDELEAASEDLAALEVARSMAMLSEGLSPDMNATDLLARIPDPDDRALLASVIDQLRGATWRLEEARERTRQIVGRATVELRSRLSVAERLASV
ncbi:MAG: hypothetical protein ACLFUG_09300 [Nitriliruptoraceae bacterium]